jgi:hypothetical protein
MGKSPNGPFGPTNGKIGKLVSYMLRGQSVTRAIGRTKKKRSVAQLAQTGRIKIVNAFLVPIKGFLNIGFMFEAEGSVLNQYNIATSYTMKNAIKGEYPNQSIDYSKAIVSAGKLKPVNELNVQEIDGKLECSWTYDRNADFAGRNDRTMIVLLFAASIEPIYFLSGSLRSEGKDVIDLGPNFPTDPCNIYLSFFAEDRQSVSNSQHFYFS